MPSKRHGYLTRKEWLAARLEDQRDRIGAFDVERLLRSTAFYQTYTRYIIAPENSGGLTYDMSKAHIPIFPPHWTEDQRRQYLTQGFVVEVRESTPKDRAQRMSPPVTVWVEPGVGALAHDGLLMADDVDVDLE